MSSSLNIARGPATVADATTVYPAYSGRMTSPTTTVANAESPVRDAGTFKNLFTYISSNNASNTSTITLQKSQVNTAVTISVLTTQTGVKEDTSNTVSFANTDEINYVITVPSEAGSHSIIVEVLACEFVPDTTTNCITLFDSAQPITISTASTTRWLTPSGNYTWSNTTEANAKFRIRTTATASNLYTYVSSNSRTTDTVISTRVNGGAGSQSVTYTSGQTGPKEDTSGTDSLVAGDDFYYQLTTGTGTQNITLEGTSNRMVTTNDDFFLLASENGVGVNFNVTTYFPAAGYLNTSTTLANTEVYPRFTFTAKELGVLVSSNTIATSNTTIHLMDNGAASSITVSYSASQTGLKNDSVNTASITTGTDEIAYRVVTPNTSGTITFRWMSILGDTSTTTTTTIPRPRLLLMMAG